MNLFQCATDKSVTQRNTLFRRKTGYFTCSPRSRSHNHHITNEHALNKCLSLWHAVSHACVQALFLYRRTFMKTIAIGADDAAVDLKNIIKTLLETQGYAVTDFTNDAGNARPMYPDVAWALATAIQRQEFERGILLCGTGIGVAIVANKVPGVRAAQCHDTFSAERARKSNNAQIMTLGARVVGPELAKNIVNAWLAAEFEGGGSLAKVEKIDFYEHAAQR